MTTENLFSQILICLLGGSVVALGQGDTPAEFEKRVVNYMLLIEPEKGELERLGPPNEISAAVLRILEKNRNARDRSEHPGAQLKAKSISILGRLKEKKAGPLIASILLQKGFHPDKTVDRGFRIKAAHALMQIDVKAYKDTLIQAFDATEMRSESSLRWVIAKGLVDVVDGSDRAFIQRLEVRGRAELGATDRVQFAEIVAQMRRRVP